MSHAGLNVTIRLIIPSQLLANLKRIEWEWGDDSWIKNNLQDQSSDPQNPCEVGQVWQATYISNNWEAETEHTENQVPQEKPQLNIKSRDQLRKTLFVNSGQHSHYTHACIIHTWGGGRKSKLFLTNKGDLSEQ